VVAALTDRPDDAAWLSALEEEPREDEPLTPAWDEPMLAQIAIADPAVSTLAVEALPWTGAVDRSPVDRTGRPLVAMRHVSRRYGRDGSTSALEDANLAIWPGEFVVVLGPSGSGKTTLLNLIGGMDQPTTGDIVATGYRISGATARGLSRYRRESVSFIFQTFNLFPALSAIENVEFGASVARRPGAEPAAVAMLTEVGLGHRLRHFPHMLSGGEQQRVAIARALATGNPIVLADEPTGELDFRTGLQILELLQAQATTGRAVIVVTHNREIARVADRVIELSSGRIVSDRIVEGPRPRLEDLHW
jgi:putative ABC transport system ATP-binding protein